MQKVSVSQSSPSYSKLVPRIGSSQNHHKPQTCSLFSNTIILLLCCGHLPPPLGARLFFNHLHVYVHFASMIDNTNGSLVYPIPDPSELVRPRTIEGIQRMIKKKRRGKVLYSTSLLVSIVFTVLVLG
jgi:hypothetical protein